MGVLIPLPRVILIMIKTFTTVHVMTSFVSLRIRVSSVTSGVMLGQVLMLLLSMVILTFFHLIFFVVHN